jgi:hypothetical protein
MKIISNIINHIKFEIDVYSWMFKLLFNKDKVEIGSKWKLKNYDVSGDDLIVEITNLKNNTVEFKFVNTALYGLPQTVSKDVFLVGFSKYK